ncbi:MAG: DUF4189 domain-containing protein [Arenimonas sp.]
MMSPKLMGIPDLQPPEVIYDPAMVDFTSQPAALKLMASGATALQPLWMAISLSPRSDMGMKVGVTKAIAEANAKKECGASDCQILLSFQGDSCTAMGSGKSTAGQSFIYMELGATEQEAKKNTLKKCKDTNSVSCEIHVAQCHDLTP